MSFNLIASEFVSIVESSTFTAITELEAVNPSPANKVAKDATVVNCSAAPSESKVKSLSPLAGVTSENSEISIFKVTSPGPAPPPERPVPAVTPVISPEVPATQVKPPEALSKVR